VNVRHVTEGDSSLSAFRTDCE